MGQGRFCFPLCRTISSITYSETLTIPSEFLSFLLSILGQDVHGALENPMVDTSLLEEFISSDIEFGTL